MNITHPFKRIYPWLIMQIPAGLLIDRFGAHKLLSLAIISLMLGTALLSMSNSIYLASAARCLSTGIPLIFG